MSATAPPPRIALFVTCLVDLYRPAVAEAARTLLEHAGSRVFVPATQTCCGQPPYNSGDAAGARLLARRTIAALEAFEHVVVPSGSCAAMIRRHYPALFVERDPWRARAEAVAAKTHELVSFLAGVLRVVPSGRMACRAAYHDACSGLRELGIKAAPRRLLAGVGGLELAEMDEAERCCGFGGLFSVKYDAVAEAIGTRKLDAAEAAGADTLVAGDLGCLLHLAGIARRQGRAIRCRHVAELLAGRSDLPPIGERE